MGLIISSFPEGPSQSLLARKNKGQGFCAPRPKIWPDVLGKWPAKPTPRSETPSRRGKKSSLHLRVTPCRGLEICDPAAYHPNLACCCFPSASALLRESPLPSVAKETAELLSSTSVTRPRNSCRSGAYTCLPAPSTTRYQSLLPPAAGGGPWLTFSCSLIHPLWEPSCSAA